MGMLWRISNYANLSGEGAMRASARWHTKGHPVVYLAESPSGALLERLVQLPDPNLEGPLPCTYDLMEIQCPDIIPIKDLLPLAGVDWKHHPELTRRIGDTWLRSRETSLARVPSAIVPRTWNVLLNPLHADAIQSRIVSTIREQFDNSVFGFRGD